MGTRRAEWFGRRAVRLIAHEKFVGFELCQIQIRRDGLVGQSHTVGAFDDAIFDPLLEPLLPRLVAQELVGFEGGIVIPILEALFGIFEFGQGLDLQHTALLGQPHCAIRIDLSESRPQSHFRLPAV